MKSTAITVFILLLLSFSLSANVAGVEISDQVIWKDFVKQIVRHEIFYQDDEESMDEIVSGQYRLMTTMGYRVLPNGDHYGLAALIYLDGSLNQSSQDFTLSQAEVSFIEMPYCDYIYQVNDNYRNRTLTVTFNQYGVVQESSELLRHNVDQLGADGVIVPANNGMCNDIGQEAYFVPIRYSTTVDLEILNVMRFITGRRIEDTTIRPTL